MADNELTAPQLVAILGPKVILLMVENELLRSQLAQQQAEKQPADGPTVIEVPASG